MPVFSIAIFFYDAKAVRSTSFKHILYISPSVLVHLFLQPPTSLSPL